jgi:hypothetical protein
MSAKTKSFWTARARNFVKGELARRGLSYDDLAVKLKQIQVVETPDNLRTKINRGTFSAAFLLQVLQAIGCKSLDLRVD